MTSMALRQFLQAPVRYTELGDTRLAYREIGRGPAIVWVHGWPLSGVTYRAPVEALRSEFTHYVLDLPGAGASPQTPFRRDFIRDGAALVAAFVESLDGGPVVLVGQDSGGTMARIAATRLQDRVAALVLFNTELPFHVPGLMRMLRAAARLPGSTWCFRRLLASRAYRRSSLGFGDAFGDKRLLDGEFHETCALPLLQDPMGALAALRSFDLAVVDELPAIHAQIHAPTLCVWGGEDPLFPVDRARAMVKDWPAARLEVVAHAKLLVHEEAPDEVVNLMRTFLQPLQPILGHAAHS